MYGGWDEVPTRQQHILAGEVAEGEESFEEQVGVQNQAWRTQ